MRPSQPCRRTKIKRELTYPTNKLGACESFDLSFLGTLFTLLASESSHRATKYERKDRCFFNCVDMNCPISLSPWHGLGITEKRPSLLYKILSSSPQLLATMLDVIALLSFIYSLMTRIGQRRRRRGISCWVEYGMGQGGFSSFS